MKKLITTLWIIVICSSLHGQSAEEKAKNLYFEALELNENKKYAESNTKLAEVQKLLGANKLSIQYLRVKNHYALKNTEQTKKEISVYLSLKPNEDEALTELLNYKAEIEKSEKHAEIQAERNKQVAAILSSYEKNDGNTLQLIDAYLLSNPDYDTNYQRIQNIKGEFAASSLYAEIERLIENKQLPEAKSKCDEYLRLPGSSNHNKYQEVKNMQGFLPSALGVFKDPRDGETYGWIKMGNQTWMIEDLRYFTNDSKAGYSGRYYKWKDAQDVCPAGWRLPVADDFYHYKDGLPGDAPERYKQLVFSKDTTSGFTNLTGFSAMLGGIFDSGTGVNDVARGWSGQGEFSQWWTSQNDNMLNAYSYVFNIQEKPFIFWRKAAKAHYMPVRCFK